MKNRTTRNALRSSTAAAIVFAVAGTFSAFGHANVASTGSESTRLSFNELNLEDSNATEALYQRIQRAAAEVCSQTYSRIPDRACVKDTMDRTVEKIDNAQLKARHQQG